MELMSAEESHGGGDDGELEVRHDNVDC